MMKLLGIVLLFSFSICWSCQRDGEMIKVETAEEKGFKLMAFRTATLLSHSQVIKILLNDISMFYWKEITKTRWETLRSLDLEWGKEKHFLFFKFHKILIIQSSWNFSFYFAQTSYRDSLSLNGKI